MLAWNEAVEAMIDWIEAHMQQEQMLQSLSAAAGYSPRYCSSLFHRVTGMTIKQYAAARRLSLAALAIRDTQARLLDIALDYGFSSQQALSRAFVYAYGCTPAAYRRQPRPIRIMKRKEVLFPEYYESEGETIMSKTVLTEPTVRIEYIPAHKFIGIRDASVQDYFSFFETRNCDEICGVIESMSHVAEPVLPSHTAGWFYENGKRGYFYGLGVPQDYSGAVPEGFSLFEIPGSYYLAFSHPPFDFLKDCETVIPKVDALAAGFDPKTMGYRWNEAVCQDYQRMSPETTGYEVLRPIKK